MINTLSRQLDEVRGPFRTVYIGGGTPTALRPGLLENLLTVLEKRVDGFSEFTIEVNPDSIDREKMSLFLDKRVNRLSIGVQSFNDDKLKRLGRIHDGVTARDAVLSAHRAHFRNINIDMIFGLRQETVEEWAGDLKAAVSLPVQHISCYCLTYEKNEAREEKAALMYEYATDELSRNGFMQYEISNFSKDGCRCLHNMNYWDNGPYIGLGPSAVSYIDGERGENTRDISEYIERADTGRSPAISYERLTPERGARETAAVKIRTMEGIDFEWFRQKTGFEFMDLEEKALPGLIEKGLIEYIFQAGAGFQSRLGTAVRLTQKGKLFCDIVSSAFL